MLRLRICWRLLPGLLCAVPLLAEAQQGAPIFLTAAWRNAPKSGGQAWSRDGMLESLPAAVLARNARRQDVVGLLGQPGLTTESFAFGADRAGRREAYRLSRVNDRTLKIVYDPQKRVESHEVSPPGCTFPAAAATSTVPKPLVTEKLVKLGRGPGGEQQFMTVAEFSARVGVPATYWWAHATTGGRNWMTFGKVWRLAGEQRRYLSVASSIAVPYSAEPPSPDVLKLMDADNSIGGFQLVTFWPDCLPP